MSLNSLPSELKRRIIEETGEYKTTVNVSKEWRHMVNTSKKLMQRELDEYCFFFYIWYDYDAYEKAPHPFPYHWRDSHRYPIEFVFPIATEEQFHVLKRFGNSKHSQVAAVAKNGALKSWNAYIFPSKLSYDWKQIELEQERDKDMIAVGNTETLVARIKTCNIACNRGAYLSKKNPIYQYLQEAINGIEYNGHFNCNNFEKVKFSSLKEMEKLLRGEHKLYNDDLDLYFVKPRYYNILEKFSTSIVYKGKQFPPFSKSLIIPRWGVELKTESELKRIVDRYIREMEREMEEETETEEETEEETEVPLIVRRCYSL